MPNLGTDRKQEAIVTGPKIQPINLVFQHMICNTFVDGFSNTVIQRMVLDVTNAIVTLQKLAKLETKKR